jgi:PPOX class probable F420-dependent enzyme
MPGLTQFEKQQYLSIETFRKNGNSVRTPVWFVQEGEKLFIWTEASSGKVKRIRNNGSANIVPSKGDGTPVGEWLAASAAADDCDAAIQHVKELMSRKYGFVFSIFELLGKLRGAKHTSIQVEIKTEK